MVQDDFSVLKFLKRTTRPFILNVRNGVHSQLICSLFIIFLDVQLGRVFVFRDFLNDSVDITQRHYTVMIIYSINTEEGRDGNLRIGVKTS